MKVAILGATGRIGRHVLAEVLAAGHEVRALAREPAALALVGGLVIVRGDALDADAVAEVVEGTEAVLSALGPRGDRSADLLARAAAGVVGAMTGSGVRRYIGVSAAGAFVAGDPDSGVLVKAILPRVLARPFADVRAMEAAVRGSDLDWTLVRATRLVGGPRTGRYRVAPAYPPRGGRKISRADVAHFIGQALAGDTWSRDVPALAY